MDTDNNDIWNILSDLKNEINNIENPNNNHLLDTSDKIVCSCGCEETVFEETMQMCANCSAIIGKVIDNTAEWRYYGNEDNRDSDPSRCGLPTNNLLPKSSLGSMIGCCRKDNIDIRRIRMFQMWNSMPYDERTLWNVFDKLTNNTINNGIPQKVIDDAKVLYKKASEKKISRGDNKEGLIASCIYHSCLINNIPRSSKEIAKMFSISPVTLNRGNSRFQTLLQINVSSSSPDDFISRFGSQLNMNFKDIQKCKKLVSFLETNEIMNDNAPTSSAAGILYYYSQIQKLDYTKKQIADICSVSEVTIIKCYKLINKYNDFINRHKEELFN
jgi:transcription initiation factor TFIIB